jgi:hypothetical protein
LLVGKVVEGAASGLVAEEEVGGEGAFVRDGDAACWRGGGEERWGEGDVAVGVEEKANAVSGRACKGVGQGSKLLLDRIAIAGEAEVGGGGGEAVEVQVE